MNYKNQYSSHPPISASFARNLFSLFQTKKQRTLEKELSLKSLAIENSMDGMAILDSDGRYVYLNRAHAAVYGFSNPEDMLGTSWRNLYNEVQINEFETKHLPELHHTGSVRLETIGKKKDGALFPQELSLTSIPGGGLICVVRDISARKVDEERIQLSRIRQQLLNDMVRAIGYGASYNQVVSRTLEQLIAYFPKCRVSYSTLNGQGILNIIDSKQSPNKQSLIGTELDMNLAPEYLAAVRALHKVVIADLRMPNVLSPFAEGLASFDIRSVLDVPFKISDQELGIICFDCSDVRVWSEHEKLCAKEATEYLALALRECLDREERYRAYDALAESEERFRNLADNAPILIWLTDAQLKSGYVNKRWSQLTGFSLDEFSDRWSDLVHPDDREAVTAKFETALRLKIGFSLEYRIKTAAGQYRWLFAEGTPRTLADGTFVGLIGCCIDIDDRKRTEDLLRYREKQLAAQNTAVTTLARSGSKLVGSFELALQEICATASKTLNCQRVNIWVFDDLHSKISCVSSYDSNNKTSLLGHSLLKSAAPLYFDVIETERVLAIQNAKQDPISLPFLESYLIPNNVGALLDAPIVVGGVTIGIVCHEHVGDTRNWSVEEQSFAGTIADIVAQVFQDREKRQLEAELLHAQKMEAVGQLAGGIAHDFNNILTGILGYASMLREDFALPPSAANLAEKIESAGLKAKELTGKLLGFARKGKNRHVPIDLHRAIRDSLSIVSGSIGENISIIERLDAKDCCLVGDPVQIGQVILNLAINSKDAMDPQICGRRSGQLRISTRNTLVTNEIASRTPNLKPGKHVELIISDTGCGISEEIRARIFEPFFTTKPDGKGSGLGLSMVYGIVKNHGGAITVESTPDEGTTFRLLLPTATSNLSDKIEVEISHPILDAGNAALGSHSAHILLIDDDTTVCDASHLMLITAGHKVTTASSGDEGIELYRRYWRDIDLVILDMIMPNMNANDCLNELRKINPEVKTVLTTGYGSNNAVEELLSQGMLGFIQKPFRYEHLKNLVAACIS